jgi:hypothetical protein
VENFWDDSPFMVINSDIATDIDFRKVYDFHLDHPFPATLVLTDSAHLNSVSCDKKNFITDFYIPKAFESPPSNKETIYIHRYSGAQQRDPGFYSKRNLLQHYRRLYQPDEIRPKNQSLFCRQILLERYRHSGAISRSSFGPDDSGGFF